MTERFIAFEGVRKSYDGKSYVVRGLDLDVAKGEFLTLLGPSGSGKTTTLMMPASASSAFRRIAAISASCSRTTHSSRI
jgi:ABC-type Fe3+/spermidine/putrescine transport system ATPase subunit